MHLIAIAEQRIEELYAICLIVARRMQNSTDETLSDGGYELEAVIMAARRQRLVEKLRRLHKPYEVNQDVSADWHPRWRPPTGKTLTRFAKRHHLSDNRIASIVGVSRPTVQMWLGGKRSRIPFACWRLLLHHASTRNVYLSDKTYRPMAKLPSHKKWMKPKPEE